MTNIGHSIHAGTTGPPAGSAAPAALERRRWLILAVMVLCLLVVVLDNTVLNVALPRIQQELGASQSQQEWIVDAYTLVFAALLLPYGVLADRLGRRPLMATEGQAPHEAVTAGNAAVSESVRHHVSGVYDRLAGIYDLYTAPMEWLGGTKARTRLFRRASGRVLEVGAGTGLSFSHYPENIDLTALDISPRMLARASRRAVALGRGIRCVIGDVEKLPYPDAAFDTITAACTFCSVGDPVQGLREVRRVVKPNGQVLLYEHVRPRNPLLGWLADLLSPLTRRLFGPSINQRTEQNVQIAGLQITDIRRRGIWREIVARRR